MTWPSRFRIGAALSSIGHSVPSAAINTVSSARHNDAVGQRARDRAGDWAAACFADNLEYLGAIVPACRGKGPPGQPLSDRIHKRGQTLCVCGDHRVPDALKRRFEPSRCSARAASALPLFSDVAKHEHYADDASCRVVNRRALSAMGTPFRRGSSGRCGSSVRRRGRSEEPNPWGSGPVDVSFVDDAEDVCECPARCRVSRPPGQGLRVAIEVRHVTIRIRGDDTVTDATQRDAKPFLLRRDFTREALLLRDVADGLRHGDDRAVRLAHWRDGDRDVTRWPSFAIRTVSKCSMRSPRRILARIASSSDCRSAVSARVQIVQPVLTRCSQTAVRCGVT